MVGGLQSTGRRAQENRKPKNQINHIILRKSVENPNKKHLTKIHCNKELIWRNCDTFDTWAFCDMQLRRLFKRPLSAISDRFEVNLAKLSSFGISDNLNQGSAGPDFRTDVIRQMIMAFRGRTESINPSSIEFMINHDPELDSYLKNLTTLYNYQLEF